MSLMDTAKDVVELVKKGATIELQERLMKLREEALALQEDNHQLRSRVAELEKKLKLHNDLVFEAGMYWLTKEDGKRDGPFCQKCHDTAGRLIRLQDGRERVACSDWLCFECQTTYGRHYDAPSRNDLSSDYSSDPFS